FDRWPRAGRPQRPNDPTRESTMNTTDDQPPYDPEDEETALVPLDDINARIRQAEEVLADLNARTMTFVREHPGVCIAGALALGYLVGRAASRRWLRLRPHPRAVPRAPTPGTIEPDPKALAWRATDERQRPQRARRLRRPHPRAVPRRPQGGHRHPDDLHH